MPKIPIPNIPRLPEHRDNAVHFNSAPGLDWNVDHSDPGQGWRDLGRGALRAGLSIGGDLMDIAERKKDAEDNDLFQEYQLKLLRADNDLKAYMRENPDAWNDYARMNANWREELQPELKEIYDRMSPDMRKSTDFYREKLYLQQDATVEQYSYQGFATSKMTNLDNRVAELAKLGGQQELAFRMIEDCVLTGVLTQEMADARKEHFMEQDDFFRARELIEAGDPEILGKLNKKSGDSYSEFTHLTREQRDQLKRVAETQKNKMELEDNHAFLAEAVQGNMPSEEQLKQQHKEGKLTDEQFVFRMDRVKQFQAEAEREQNRAEQNSYYRIVADAYNGNIMSEDELKKQHKEGAISDKLFNETSEFLKRFQTNKENEAEREHNKQIKENTEEFAARVAGGYPVKYSSFDELKTALENGSIGFDEFNNYWNILSKHEQALEQAAAKRTENAVNSYKWQISQAKFPMLPYQTYSYAKGIWGEIQQTIKDPKLLLDLNSFLQKKVNDTLTNSEDEFSTAEGQKILNFINNKYVDQEKGFKGLIYDDGWFWDGDNSQEHQRAQFYALKEIARKKLANGEQEEKIEEYIVEQVRKMNKGVIRNVLEQANSTR